MDSPSTPLGRRTVSTSRGVPAIDGSAPPRLAGGLQRLQPRRPRASREPRGERLERSSSVTLSVKRRARLVDERDGVAQRGGRRGPRRPPQRAERGRRRGRDPARRRRRTRRRAATARRAAAPGRARPSARGASARLAALGALALGPPALALGQQLELAPRARASTRRARGVAAALARRASSSPHGRSADGRRAAPRARSASAAGAQRRAVADRERAARARRRRARAARRRRPRPASTPGRRSSRAAISSAGGASKRTGWQREAIVGSTLAGPARQQDEVRERRRLLERLEHLVRGLSFIVVGALDDEHAPARLERRARGGGDDRLVDVADEHLVRAAGRHPREVGMRRRAATRAARVVRIGRALGQQLGGERARRRRACPRPAGPWNR